MKVISICSPKGGATKTTLTALLAVRAAKDSKRVAMFDLNVDQGNLTQWWSVRGREPNPGLYIDVEDIAADATSLARQGADWLFIDTPPLDMDVIETAVALADLVLVPVRCSMLDVGSIGPVVEMCRARRKPFRFVLSAVDAKHKGIVATTADLLAQMGPILDVRVSYRVGYINAMTVGKTGPEEDKALAGEIDALWSEVKALASPVSKKGRVNVG